MWETSVGLDPAEPPKFLKWTECAVTLTAGENASRAITFEMLLYARCAVFRTLSTADLVQENRGESRRESPTEYCRIDMGSALAAALQAGDTATAAICKHFQLDMQPASALSLLTCVLGLAKVLGHGEMTYPWARNLDPERIGYTAHCPQCGNAGGTSLVQIRMQNTGGTFPAEYPVAGNENTHGLCGDPFQNLADANGVMPPISQQPFMAAGNVMARWREGQEVDIQVAISTNHRGFFEFRICDEGIDLNTPSQTHGQRCLDRHLLERVDPEDRQECTGVSLSERPDCQPLDKSHPSRWYIPPSETGTMRSSFPNHPQWSMRYRLPMGLTCSKCTMQWWYLTANSCHPEGEEEYWQQIRDYPGAWQHNHDLSSCSNSAQTEQFFNCADIRIEPADGSTLPPAAGPEDPPPLNPPPEPTPSGPTSPPTLPPPPSVTPGECNLQKWATCGADHGCCGEGLECYENDQFYSQCRPVGDCPPAGGAATGSWTCLIHPKPDTETPPPPPPPFEVHASCASDTPIELYGNCTGQHSGCCEEGLVCYQQDGSYAQCRAPGTCPHCSWDCTPVLPPCQDAVGKHGNCAASHCCAEGLVCYQQDDGYAQCLPPGECPTCDSWSCNILLPGLDIVSPPPRRSGVLSVEGAELEDNQPVFGARIQKATEELWWVSFVVGTVGAVMALMTGFEFGRRKERLEVIVEHENRLVSIQSRE